MIIIIIQTAIILFKLKHSLTSYYTTTNIHPHTYKKEKSTLHIFSPMHFSLLVLHFPPSIFFLFNFIVYPPITFIHTTIIIGIEPSFFRRERDTQKKKQSKSLFHIRKLIFIMLCLIN